MARAVREEIRTELGDLILGLRSRLPAGQLSPVWPSARRVRHHAPTHPRPRGRRRHERFSPLVRQHALYDWLRDSPRNGRRQSEEVSIEESA